MVIPIRPSYELSANRSARRGRLLMTLLMLALLAVVVAMGYRAIPSGTVSLSNRQARKLLSDGQRFENESLYISAAQLYEQVAGNTKVTPKYRLQAAQRLVMLYRGALDNPQATEAALEKAYYLTPAGDHRETLRRDLELLRGRPVVSQAEQEATPVTSPQNRRVIAQIGKQTVTLEEVLYAWHHFYPQEAPQGDDFERFVKIYLDMVLMADEASRLGLERTGATALNLSLNRVLSLNQAMTQVLLKDIDQVSEQALQEYYQSNAQRFAVPASVRVGEILCKDQGEAQELMDRIEEGEDFGKLARKYSQDAALLEEGYILGTVEAGGRHAMLGGLEALGERLTQMPDGATTGPLQSVRGYHLIKVLEKTPGSQPAFDQVRDAVWVDYQKRSLERMRQRTLERLRNDRPIIINEDALAPEPGPATQDQAATATLDQDAASTPTGPLEP